MNILKKPDARLDLMCDLSGTITDNYKGITWQLPWGKEVSQPTETWCIASALQALEVVAVRDTALPPPSLSQVHCILSPVTVKWRRGVGLDWDTVLFGHCYCLDYLMGGAWRNFSQLWFSIQDVSTPIPPTTTFWGRRTHKIARVFCLVLLQLWDDPLLHLIPVCTDTSNPHPLLFQVGK